MPGILPSACGGGRALEALPQLLAHVDSLLADHTIATDPPNAAALQILSSVRLLDALSDLHEQVSAYECAQAARELFPRYPGPVPAFLPPQLTASMQADR